DGGKRQRLGGVDDHLHEPGRRLPIRPRTTGPAHLLPGQRVHPIHPRGIRRRIKTQLSSHRAGAVERDELRYRRLRAQVVVVSTGTVGLDIAQSVSPSAPEREHTTTHPTHLPTELAYLLLPKLAYVHSEEQGQEPGRRCE